RHPADLYAFPPRRSSDLIGNEGQRLVGAPNEDGGANGDVYRYGTAEANALDDNTAEDRGAVYAYAASGELYSFKAYVKPPVQPGDRKSTRLNSSHVKISY